MHIAGVKPQPIGQRLVQFFESHVCASHAAMVGTISELYLVALAGPAAGGGAASPLGNAHCVSARSVRTSWRGTSMRSTGRPARAALANCCAAVSLRSDSGHRHLLIFWKLNICTLEV